MSDQVEDTPTNTVLETPEGGDKKKKNELSSNEKLNMWQGRIEKNKKRENKEKKYTGVVISVVSGDTLRILPSDVLYSNDGVPEPILVRLKGVSAPHLERVVQDENQGNVRLPDEEFAWSSREFLREMLIGQPVIYQIPHSQGPNNYGNVWMYNQGDLVSVIEEAISNGWVNVNRRTEFEGKDYESAPILEYKRMIKLEEEARQAGLGIHCKSKAKAQASIRHVHKHTFGRRDNKAAFDLFEKIKEIPQHGIVERVRSGTSLRIILLDRMDEINIDLSGVQSPFGKNEPYAYEAEWFTRHYLENRDVIVYLELMDSSNRFYATVKLKDNPEFDITIELLKNGLARLVDWSVSKGAYMDELRAAEESAKEKNLRIWESHKEKKNSSSSFKHEFNGKVVEVVNSGTLRVLPKGASDSVFVQMSSLKPLFPKPSKFFDSLDKHVKAEMEKDVAFSFMGKDFTRKLLVGKNVTCIEDYVYKKNKFYSVFLKELNVSLRVLEEGWARIQNHTGDSDRSPQYQQMVLAYNRASKSGRGVHGSLSNAQTHFNDLTTEDPKKTQMFFGFFQRAGRVSAVVERVFAGATFKIRIPSQNNVILRFCCEGCYADKVTRDDNEYPDTPGNRALAYSKKHLYQRDVEVIIGSVDKKGSFYGRLYNNNKDYAISLLEEGYAKLRVDTVVTMAEYEQYKDAEEKAKNHKPRPKNMWENYDPEEEKRQREKRKLEAQKARSTSSNQFPLLITEIIDGSHFWYQNTEQAQGLMDLMAQVSQENLEEQEPYRPNPNELVFAKFNVDGNYYRTNVTRSREQDGETVYSVIFIDYGNVQNTSSENIRKLDGSKYGLKVLPAQALQGNLAFVRAPKLNEEFGYESAQLFKELVYENENLIATSVARDKNGIESLNIGDETTQVYINAALVSAGLAQVENFARKKKKGKEEDDPLLHKELKKLENEVKSDHLNMWRHGEPPDSDEEREEQMRLKGLI